jgi:hypothetical protein
MNPASSVVTGGVTVTAATLAPLVSWAINGFAQPYPETLPYLIAAAIVTAVHGACNLVAGRSRVVTPELPQAAQHE